MRTGCGAFMAILMGLLGFAIPARAQSPADAAAIKKLRLITSNVGTKATPNGWSVRYIRNRRKGSFSPILRPAKAAWIKWAP